MTHMLVLWHTNGLFFVYVCIGGQKQANRVSKQISKCTSKIAKLLDKYKSLTSDLND